MPKRATKGEEPMALPLTDRVIATAMAAGAGYNTESLTGGRAPRRALANPRGETGAEKPPLPLAAQARACTS